MFHNSFLHSFCLIQHPVFRHINKAVLAITCLVKCLANRSCDKFENDSLTCKGLKAESCYLNTRKPNVRHMKIMRLSYMKL